LRAAHTCRKARRRVVTPFAVLPGRGAWPSTTAGQFAGVPRRSCPRPGIAGHGTTHPKRSSPRDALAKAEQLVRERGGRLLYMPGPDLK
jgi:hypothetical protein